MEKDKEENQKFLTGNSLSAGHFYARSSNPNLPVSHIFWQSPAPRELSLWLTKGRRRLI